MTRTGLAAVLGFLLLAPVPAGAQDDDIDFTDDDLGSPWSEIETDEPAPRAPRAVRPVPAVDEVDFQALDTEIVTATRRSLLVSDAPATTVVITAEQIRDRGYTDLKDLFFDLPGFDLSQATTGEVRTLVIVRGALGNNKIQVLVDGRKLNASTGERFIYGNNIPIHHAKRIEIVYGPASAMYGADAYGAVVNIISRKGRDVRGVEVTSLLGTDDTSSNTVVAGLEAGDLDLLVSGKFYRTAGQVMSMASAYPELGPILKYPLSYDIGQPVRDYDVLVRVAYRGFGLDVQLNRALEPNGQSTIPNQYMYIPQNLWGQRTDRVTLSYRAWFLDDRLSSDTSINYQEYEVTPDTNFYLAQERDAADIPTTAIPEYKYAFSSSVKLEQRFGLDLGESLDLLAGVSYEKTLSFPKTKNLPQGRHDPDHLVDDMSQFVDPDNGKVFGFIDGAAFGVRPSGNVGSYAQLEYRPIDLLHVTVGARYDFNTVYGGTFNPRVGVVSHVRHDLSFKALFGTAYIQPSNYYRWENWANPYAMHVPNLDLEPERIRTYELGAHYRLGRVGAVQLAVYRNEMTDIIRPRPIDPTSVYNPFLIIPVEESYAENNSNFGTQWSQGLDLLLLGYSPSMGYGMRVWGSVGYSLLMGEDVDTGDDLNKVSAHKVAVAATMQASLARLTARLRWVSAIATAASNSEFGGDPFPGHVLLNLTLRVALPGGLAVVVRVDNVLNTPYYAAAPFAESVWVLPRAPQPLRSVLIGLSYAYEYEQP